VQAAIGQVTALSAARHTWRPLLIGGHVLGAAFGLILIGSMDWHTDAAVYRAADLDHLYTGVVGDPMAYLYSPAFAQLLEPLRVLPTEAFVMLFRLIALACVVALAGPLSVFVLLLAPVTGELMVANVHLQLGALTVAGLLFPPAWALVAMAKPTVAVGLFWFVGRRDWRSLGLALGCVAATVAVSFALAPQLWSDWLATLIGSFRPLPAELAAQTIPIPLVARLPVAAVLAYASGRSSQPWLVPIACSLALPTMWLIGISMMVASLAFVVRPQLSARAVARTTPIELGSQLRGATPVAP